MSLRVTAFCTLVLLSLTSFSQAEDWPRWRGAMGDAIWRESGIIETLPAELPVVWRVPCELGYSGPAVADGKVYLFEYEKKSGTVTNNPGGRDELTGVERLRCLDANSGEEFWSYEYDRPYNVSYPSGPRCTPTVDGEKVYLLGTEGDLTCLSTADGSLIWKKSFADEYGAVTPLWGHSAHPLVDGDTLYCLVGGEGSIAVAFNKNTGEELWRTLSSYDVGYAPPTMIEHNGEKQLLVFHPEAISGLVPKTGESLWSVPIKPEYGMSIAQPIKTGNRIFATGYGGGVSVCFELPDESGVEPNILWSGTPKTSLSAANATPVIDKSGEVIYGCHANGSLFVAVDLKDGNRLWSTQKPTLSKASRARHGTAFLVRQGDTDRYWLASETGDLILAKLTPEKYEELGRVSLVAPSGETFGRSVVWSHPAFANQCVYARNDEEIVCYSLAAE